MTSSTTAASAGSSVRGLGQAVDQLRQAARQRVVAFGERGGRLRRRVDQACGIGEPALRRGELLPFAGRQRERGQVVLAIGEALALLGTRARIGRGGFASFGRIAPRPPCRGKLVGERAKLPETVQQLALRLGAGERLVRVLAVQVEQQGAHFRELRQCGRPAVDPRATSALRVEHAAQQQLGAGIELVRREPVTRGILRAEVEGRRELGTLGAWPQLAQLETIPQQKGKGVEEDRLAGAGLAGQDREPGPELDIQRVDDDEIADRQQAQHAVSGPGPRD